MTAMTNTVASIYPATTASERAWPFRWRQSQRFLTATLRVVDDLSEAVVGSGVIEDPYHKPPINDGKSQVSEYPQDGFPVNSLTFHG